jgi:hypothetical protein
MTRRGLFYTGLQTYEDFTFVLATLGNTAYVLNYMYLYYRSEQLPAQNQFIFFKTDHNSATQDKL